MQVPLLQGAYADSFARFRTSYPRNLEPVLVESGISNGYLRSPPGVTLLDTGPGADRGAITWQNVCYRVMGTKLCRVDGDLITILGDVGAGGPVAFDYSFDCLSINSGVNLFYWNGAVLTQNVDPDLGVVLDQQWIAGYFMTTDGTSIIVTELLDRYAVDPLKYGSSEVDPDPVMCLRKVRNEAYAINRYTIQNLQNVGGLGFPFQNYDGGLIPKGAVGTRARCDYLETFAFVGGGRNEAISVYLAGQGEAIPIGTVEVDTELAALTDAQQAAIEIESRTDKDEQRLYVHLPDKTLVYYRQASLKNDAPVWAVLAGGANADQLYPAKHMALAQTRWLVGSPSGQLGYLDQAVSTQYGATAGIQFDTAFFYNAGMGGILKSVDIAALTGVNPGGGTPLLYLSTSRDGRNYTTEEAIDMGAAGDTLMTLEWRPKKRFSNYMGVRIRGSNAAIASFARLEVELEPLAA